MARPAGDDLSEPGPLLGQRVGARIRARRTELALTLAQTALAAKVSVSHLSSIETGSNLPSLPILARIAAALGLSLHEVLRDVGGGSAIRRDHVDDGEIGVRGLSHPGLQLEIAVVVAARGDAGTSPLPPEGAEVFVYVRSGTLEATVDGEAYLLEAGDSLDAEEPAEIAWRNAGSTRSVSIWARGPARSG